MQVLILAGGLGKRLRSMVNDRPKPMALVGEKPFLEYQLEFLRANGFRDVVFCLGYLHERVEAYFGDGSRWDLNINYSVETERLGTGGALKFAERFVQRTFVALNGDSFFRVDMDQLVQFHRRKVEAAREGSYLGTIALTRVAESGNYGSVTLDSSSGITGFYEKADASMPAPNGSRQVNAGIYVLEPAILDLIPASQPVSIEKQVFPEVLGSGRALGGCPLDGFFVDIGTPEGYQAFREYQKERRL
jgi:D-glycero-alpha-D-manno-heptose 1-phosphate guanylyltransferase